MRRVRLLAVLPWVICCNKGPPSDQVAKTEERVQSLEQRLSIVETRAKELEGVVDVALEAKSVLEKREELLSKKEAVVTRIVEGIRASSFADGTWEVGKDIMPGKYKALEPDGRCYWEKSTGGDGIGSIVANDNARGPTTVIISPKVAFFKTRGCGTWVKTD